MNRFITIGGEPKGQKMESICLAGQRKLHPRSIDLERFVSAKIVKVNTTNCMIVVRLRGSGWLKYIKDSQIEVYYFNEEGAREDYDLLMENVNKWNKETNKTN